LTRLLFDTNIVLDVLLERVPHSEISTLLWAALEETGSQGLVAAHAITTIHYVIARTLGQHHAMRAISKVLEVFDVANVDDGIIRTAVLVAMEAEHGDFEDAVTAAAAKAARCELIVTRDPKGFRHSPIPAMAPEEALRLIAG
jgi:predicted nucleic acid-binding protein